MDPGKDLKGREAVTDVTAGRAQAAALLGAG